MTKLVWGLMLACFALNACAGESGTYVLVRVEQGSAPVGVTKVSLALSLGLEATSRDLENGGLPLTFPLTAAFEIGKAKGDLNVTATAFAGEVPVAQGIGSTVVVRDKTSTVSVTLAAGIIDRPGIDGGTTDADIITPPTDGPVTTDAPDAMKTPDATMEVMPMPGAAMLVANRSSVDFGTTLIGMMSPSVSIKVTNAGNDVSGSLSVSLSGSLAFSTANDVCSGKGLKPDDSCTTSVVFMPSAAGAAQGSITIKGSPGGTIKIDLAATGVAPGALQINPVTSSFAETEKGKSSVDVEFTVSNTGGAATGPLAVALSGSDAQDFSLGANTCSNIMVGTSGTCKVAVSFKPKTEGAKSASITVTGSPGGTAVASLDGKSLAPASFQISPASNNFGSVVKAQKSGFQVFEVKNTGGVSSAAPVAAITNDAMNSFKLGTNTCTTALAPSATCQVEVQFIPADVGGFVAKIEVTAGTLKVVADLLGTGLAPGSLEISPLTFNFDPTVIGAKSAAKTFTVKNAGGASTGALTAILTGSATADFPLTSNTCANAVLAPNQTCTIVVQLQPSAPGTRSASLAVSAVPGGGVTAQMSGDGLTPASISLSPAGETFGSVVTMGTVDRTFTVTNTGDVATGTLAFNVSGTNAAEFTILAGGAGDCIMGTTKLDSNVTSCKLRVRFTPTGVGIRAATLNVSAIPGGAKSANIDGTGLAQGQLSVNASSRDFGLVEVGTSSSSFTWKVTNVGGVPTGVPVLSSSIPAAFLVTNNCTAALAPNQSCDVLVSFKPGSGGTQNFTLNINAVPGGMAQLSMTGRGGYRLTVTTTGIGRGTVTSNLGGISCPGTCAAVLDSGTMVILNAQTENGSDSYFTGFRGMGCQGPGNECSGTLSTAPANVSANFNQLDANLVFVSSEAFPTDYGSSEKYDSLCNELASKAGINDKSNSGFIAWMSDDNSVAYKRLAGANGWRRRDGVPVAPNLDLLVNSNEIWNPIVLDENGNGGGTNIVMTGTNADGTPAVGGNCGNWNKADASLVPATGDRTAGPGAWTNGVSNTNCSTRNRIYCFGNSRSVTLAHSALKGRRIYLSGTSSVGKLYTPGGNGPLSGIVDADAVCLAAAPRGALSVKALLAQDGRSAAAVINGSYFYVTPSGEGIGQGDQILKGPLFTGIWQTADGTFASPSTAYTGAPNMTTNGDSLSTCKNWAGGIGLNGPILGFTSSTQASFFNAMVSPKNSCSVARPIYCVEQ